MNCDVLVVHPHKHHLLDFSVGAFRRYPNSFYVTPFYRNGVGALVARLPGIQGAKAQGYWHPALLASQVVSPPQWQWRKLFSHVGYGKVVRAFDQWVAEKIYRKNWVARAVVTVQDYLPQTAMAAKSAGSILISDQISNQSSDAMARIARHRQAFGLGVMPHNEATNNAVLQLADHVTAPSRYVAEGLVGRLASSAHLHIVPYGTDGKRFNAGGFTRQEDGPIRVVARANSIRKGGHLLLHALERVGRQLARNAGDRGVEILFLGAMEPVLVPLLERVSRELRGVVQISARNYAHAEVPLLLTRSSMFLMPSLTEGMSLVAFEAANCGLPLILSKYCGVDAFVPDLHGLEIDDTVESVAQALTTAFSCCEMWPIWSDQARDMARTFTWERYQAGIAEVFQHVG